jgi:hypothetical protein
MNLSYGEGWSGGVRAGVGWGDRVRVWVRVRVRVYLLMTSR